MCRVWPLLFILVILLITTPVLGQEMIIESTSEPYPCPYPNTTYYQAGAFPRYEASTGELVLADVSGMPIHVLDQITENVRIINWSPNCRYLAGAVGKITMYGAYDEQEFVAWERGSRSIVIWDAINGGRLQVIANPGQYPSDPAVIWSPDAQYALLRAGCPSVRHSCIWERYSEDWLWHSTTNTLQPVGEASHGSRLFSGALFNQYDWDFGRGVLWGSARDGVIAYDFNSGAEKFSFPAGRGVEGRFIFSDDRSKIVIYGTPDPIGGWLTRVGVYDIATGGGTEVNVESFLFPRVPYIGDAPIALSPDNRYLVIGYNALRVWDLQNLSLTIQERLPLYRHGGPEALIRGVRFVSPSTIQTISDEGVQNWDLYTGMSV